MAETTAHVLDPNPFGPTWTIVQAAQLHHQLLSTLEDTAAEPGAEWQLSVQLIDEIDSAGLQLMVALKQSLHQRGHRLTLTELTPLMHTALDTYGLDEHLVPRTAPMGQEHTA